MNRFEIYGHYSDAEKGRRERMKASLVGVTDEYYTVELLEQTAEHCSYVVAKRDLSTQKIMGYV